MRVSAAFFATVLACACCTSSYCLAQPKAPPSPPAAGGTAGANAGGTTSRNATAESLELLLNDAEQLLLSSNQLDRLYAIGLIRQALLTGTADSAALTTVRQRGVTVLVGQLGTSPNDTNLTAYAAAEALAASAERTAHLVRLLLDPNTPVSSEVIRFNLGGNPARIVSVDDPVVQGHLATSQKLPAAKATDATKPEFLARVQFLKILVTTEFKFPVNSIVAARLLEYTNGKKPIAEMPTVDRELWNEVLDALAAGATGGRNDIVRADCARAISGEVMAATDPNNTQNAQNGPVRRRLLTHLAQLARSDNPYVAHAALTGLRDFVKSTTAPNNVTTYSLRVTDAPDQDELVKALAAVISDTDPPFVAEQAAMIAAYVAAAPELVSTARNEFRSKLAPLRQSASPMVRAWLDQALANLAFNVSGIPPAVSGVSAGPATVIAQTKPLQEESRFFAGGAGISTAGNRPTASDAKTVTDRALALTLVMAGDLGGVTAGRHPRTADLERRPVPNYVVPDNQKPGLRGKTALPPPQNLQDGKRLPPAVVAGSAITVPGVGGITDLNNTAGATALTPLVNAPGATRRPTPDPGTN